MNERIRNLINYILDRMCEASTWQGVGFFLALAGVKWGAGLDWGAAAAAGGVVSGAIKAIVPDILK